MQTMSWFQTIAESKFIFWPNIKGAFPCWSDIRILSPLHLVYRVPGAGIAEGRYCPQMSVPSELSSAVGWI